ncbi:hypothetical protein pipiens_000401, partial [Culex pipiens pipiens]
MELEAAYEALADYSLQEAPFYEAPLKAPVPATEADQQNPLLSFRSALFSAQFQRDIMAASSLMLPANSGATGGKGMQLNGGMQSALVPALASSTGKPKKNMKKSVSFLPTFVQSYDGESQIQLKQEPMDEGPPHHGRNIQKVPSLSDLSDPEASLGE